MDAKSVTKLLLQLIPGLVDFAVSGLREHVTSILHAHGLTLEPIPPIRGNKGCQVPGFLRKGYLVIARDHIEQAHLGKGFP